MEFRMRGVIKYSQGFSKSFFSFYFVFFTWLWMGFLRILHKRLILVDPILEGP
jgi:hypothetical protein